MTAKSYCFSDFKVKKLLGKGAFGKVSWYSHSYMNVANSIDRNNVVLIVL